MTKIYSSPGRHTFQMNNYIRRTEEKGEELDKEYLDMFESIRLREMNQIHDPEWQKNNMEYDLRSTDWITQKTKVSESYAQNLYAAMCNNDFRKLPEPTPEGVIDTLAGKLPMWSCSWRHAGGIIADMREEGDYIDWYCSGIRDIGIYEPDAGKELTEEQKARLEVVNRYVAESVVTDEIRDDLLRLGWEVIPYNGD